MFLQGFSMLAILHVLAQMNIDTSHLDGRPPINAEVGTSPMTWVIACVLVAGIVLTTFKTSKRNAVEKD
jgi:hypothetical protein